MDIYELRSFTVLAEQLHFGRAAHLLHLSQPALTKQIRKIEVELGSPLFQRGTHGTKLTALGIKWLPEARQVLQAFDALIANGKKGALGKMGTLRIGFGFSSLNIVPEVVVKLRARSPELQITLQDMSTSEQVTALREGKLDIGFLRMPVKLGPAYATSPVVQDRLVLVSGNLYAPGTLRVKDCADLPFVMIAKSRSPGFSGHVLRLCAAHGFHPRIVQGVTEFTTAQALVRAGMGVTFIPESACQNNLSGVHHHRIAGREAAWSVSAAWHKKDSNPVLFDFLRVLGHEKSKRPTERRQVKSLRTNQV